MSILLSIDIKKLIIGHDDLISRLCQSFIDEFTLEQWLDDPKSEADFTVEGHLKKVQEMATNNGRTPEELQQWIVETFWPASFAPPRQQSRVYASSRYYGCMYLCLFQADPHFI
ncbi:unnamed protein product [Didymodactylos carnosus]|uniref:Uncharacterized protein n=2 Tax=Didymodactylos carnosus TaxID=1234261 RepID=A0A8S2QUS1_9BILA|nr:unnamed protein product [Didymodactylos carnosus]CAF4128043.1 unnamed protein product [Didymodactylos carnosus]